jgi:transcription-repair coupling factor (superfamily II helicase)
MLVVRIKAMCKKAGIAKLDAGPRGATISFHNNKYASPEGLVAFMDELKGDARIRDNKIVVARQWTSEVEKIKGSFALAKALAEKAIAQKKKQRAKA